MAQPTNTFDSYDGANANREDLIDKIFNVSPTDTPVLSMCGTVNATATNHEWQTESLVAASATNAHIDGDDTTADSRSATSRLGNYSQISKKSVVVSGTEEAVNKAGMKSYLAHHLVNMTKELKRDMESSLCANNAKVAGNSTTARELAGIPSWLISNTSAGATGADPTGDGTDARTDGTQRAITESLLKTVLASCYDNGGNPDCVVVGAFNKQAISGFTGGSTRFDVGEDKSLTASVDVYISDFGTLKIVPNRFSRSRDALVLEKGRWKVGYVRRPQVKELARTGDSVKRDITCEYTLQADNEAASGIIADLTTA